MEPQDQETVREISDSYTTGNGRYAKSYPELCSEFLTNLAKAIKNTALYTLSHPVVLESLRKNCALLGMLFDAKKENELTLSFVNEVWLFNDTAVPAVTQESQNLNAFFRAHRIQGLTFIDGVQSFEIGALCEFLSAQVRNQPPGYVEKFFAEKGVGNIRPVAVHYVKDGGYSPQSQSYRGVQAPAQAPWPAESRPVPEIFPSQRSLPVTASEGKETAPAPQQQRTAAARPVQEPQQQRPPAARPVQEPQQQRPPTARPGQEPQQQRTAAARPVQEPQQQRPAAARPVQEPQQQRPPAARPVQEPPQQQRPAAKPGQSGIALQAPVSAKTDINEMFGPAQRQETAGGPGRRTPVTKPVEDLKTNPDMIFETAPATEAAGGPGGGKTAEGSGGGKTAEGPGGGKDAEGPGGGKAQESVLANMSFGGILKGLVESAVKDPKDRIRAYEDAMKMIHDTMDQQVAESTKALAAEKEQALNTRARTERVLSKVADGKVIVDKDGKILMMNPAAEEIAGTKFADAVGRHISEQLRPGEHILTMSKDMDLSGGKIVSGEVEIKGDENMGRTLRRSVAMLVDSEGRVVGELSTMPEITKYKETQRMQEEFLSRVTHDLQSPLSSITSALEMLNDAATGKLDTVESRFLDISIKNSHRLSQMIRGILDFSKLQSGKMDVHPEPSQLAPILTEAVEGLMPWAKTKGITLSLRPVSADLCALADPPRIVQVLTNLISNAIKATSEGGTVVVAAAPDPGQDGSVLIGIRDTGHGIPKEDLEKIFEKFVQLSSRQSMEGVGLGLAIVSDFIKLHSGRVWAVSEVGKGSTFYFTLPRADRVPETV